MQLLAEVPAVGEAVLGMGEAVVDPLPDEAALAALVPLEEPLVLAQTARPVAHGVPVLAHDEGHRTPPGVEFRVGPGFLRPLADEFDLGVRRIHPRVQVDVLAGEVALVVHQPLRVPPPDPTGHRGQAAARTALVAQRPDDHRGVVLVALDHAGRPVEQRRGPPLVVDGVAPPLQVDEAMRLQVALVDHPEPELVAQVEEGGVRRIVAGPHGVDVVPLHQHQIAPHRLRVDRPARLRVELVPVHPAEEQPPAVDLDDPVLDRDRAETDPQGRPLAGRDQLRVVQPGRLGGPRLDRKGHGLARGDVDTQLGHQDPAVRPLALHEQRPGTLPVVVARVHEEVPGGARGTVQQRHLSEDARQPPLVLVLQITPGRPGVHPYGEGVLAGVQQIAHGELVRQPGALEVAQLLPVEPDPGAGLHAVEPQHELAAPRPVPGQRERPQMVARRVLGRHPRRVDGEGVDDVRVRGSAAGPLEHPVAGHRHRPPRRRVELRPGERLVLGTRPRREPEGPLAVQGHPPGIGRRVPGTRREPTGTRARVLVPGQRVGVGPAHGSPRSETPFSRVTLTTNEPFQQGVVARMMTRSATPVARSEGAAPRPSHVGARLPVVPGRRHRARRARPDGPARPGTPRGGGARGRRVRRDVKTAGRPVPDAGQQPGRLSPTPPDRGGSVFRGVPAPSGPRGRGQVGAHRKNPCTRPWGGCLRTMRRTVTQVAAAPATQSADQDFS